MAKYKLTASAATVHDTETGEFIPDDPANRHWRSYQEWLAAGNIPDPQFTPEEIAENERLSRQDIRLGTLRQAVIDMFDMILALYQVGRTKGLWATTDFPDDLRTKAQEWRDIIDAYRGEEV